MRMKTHRFQTYGIRQRWFRGWGEIHSQPSLTQKKKKIEKSQIDQLTLYLRELEKKQQMKLKPRTRRERIKIGAEISELEIK